MISNGIGMKDLRILFCIFPFIIGFVCKALGQRGGVDRSSAKRLPVLAGGTKYRMSANSGGV